MDQWEGLKWSHIRDYVQYGLMLCGIPVKTKTHKKFNKTIYSVFSFLIIESIPSRLQGVNHSTGYQIELKAAKSTNYIEKYFKQKLSNPKIKFWTLTI